MTWLCLSDLFLGLGIPNCFSELFWALGRYQVIKPNWTVSGLVVRWLCFGCHFTARTSRVGEYWARLFKDYVVATWAKQRNLCGLILVVIAIGKLITKLDSNLFYFTLRFGTSSDYGFDWKEVLFKVRVRKLVKSFHKNFSIAMMAVLLCRESS